MKIKGVTFIKINDEKALKVSTETQTTQILSHWIIKGSKLESLKAQRSTLSK